MARKKNPGRVCPAKENKAEETRGWDLFESAWRAYHRAGLDSDEQARLVGLLKQSLELEPDNGSALLLLARIYLENGSHALAHGLANRAIFLEESETQAARFEKFGFSRREAYLLIGRIEESRLDFLLARQAYEKALEFGQPEGELMFRLARCHHNEGEFVLAEKCVLRALEFTPEDVLALDLRAQLQLQKKDWAGCLETFRRLENLTDLSATQYYLMGVSANHLGEFTAGSGFFEKALNASPDPQLAREIREKILSFEDTFHKMLLAAMAPRLPDSLEINCDSCGGLAREVKRSVERKKNRWLTRVTLSCPRCFFEFFHYEVL